MKNSCVPVKVCQHTVTAAVAGVLSLAQFILQTCRCSEARVHLRLSCMSWPRGGPGSLGLGEPGATHWCKGRAGCLEPQWLHPFLFSTSEFLCLFCITFFSYSIFLCNFGKSISLQKFTSALINSPGHLIFSVAEDRQYQAYHHMWVLSVWAISPS